MAVSLASSVQRFEGVEVVHPLLHRDIAGAVEPGAEAVRERGLLRLVAPGFSVPSS